MDSERDIRPSPIAGQWYSADPRRLADSIDGYLSAARMPALTGELVGVVAPHAGHRYSGPVAGYAFAALRDLETEVAAIIAPMHYPYPYPFLTTAHSAYQTPLGEIQIDRDALLALDRHLQRQLGYGLTPVRCDPEHSVEIQLPFLQRAANEGFLLLPVMVRDQTERAARALGASLAQVLQSRKAIMVASTDLSHFFSRLEAQTLDGELLRRLAAFDPLGVLQAEDEGVGFACGRAALAAVLWAAQDLGANAVQLLHYATSGDVTGDYDRVVGYGAAAILRAP
jgi:AmmeMemoRadiSam system protein B